MPADKLTRNELAKFLPTHRAIVAWEQGMEAQDTAAAALAAAQAAQVAAAAAAALAQQALDLIAQLDAANFQLDAVREELAVARGLINDLQQGYQI